MLKITVVVAVLALAIAPCAWDSRNFSDASWLATIIAARTISPMAAAIGDPTIADFRRGSL
jgi:hypothetical protein